MVIKMKLDYILIGLMILLINIQIVNLIKLFRYDYLTIILLAVTIIVKSYKKGQDGKV